MLFCERDEIGAVTIYTVCNDQGTCLIRTTNGAIARFVHEHSKGINPNLRLTVGGDPGTRQKEKPIFHHIRRYSR